MMILHRECSIGVKKLSDADLGGGVSNQTHIGLSERVFTFLPPQDINVKGILVYNKSCAAVDCLFSKILDKRSTKIDSGEASQVRSLTRQIRSIASNRSLDWYLIWFSLFDGTPVFWLFNKASEEFKNLSGTGAIFESMKVFSPKDAAYFFIQKYICQSEKLNEIVERKMAEFSEGILIASSKEHRTFVHLCLSYFDARGELDKIIPYCNTTNINSPIRVFKEGSFNLQNMLMFADESEIARRNSDRVRWYTDYFDVEGRHLYLYVDWYPGKDSLGKDQQLMIPDFVKLINLCYGDTYIYENNNGTHELWLKKDVTPSRFWILPSNNSEFRVIEYFNEKTLVDWSQSRNFAVGDIAYLYCSKGYQRVLFKTKVVRIDVPNSEYINDKKYWADEAAYDEARKDTDSKYVRLELQNKLNVDDNSLSLDVLQKLGLKGTIQGPMTVPNQEIQDKLDEVFDGKVSKQADIKQELFQISSVVSAIRSTGLIYEDLLVKRFATSLLTKPFVILSGLAGSGKTQLALAFAKALIADDSQLCVVSVGADWTNREPLLGYPNALKADEYVHPESGVLDLLIEANKAENKDKPYFLILDEMNLSYVERYFADFLSAMESHEPIRLWDCENDKTPKCVALPKNLFIIGTINVDETTYMFSPKVLDRANVIEFKVSEAEMTSFLDWAPVVNLESVEKIANQSADFVRIAKNSVEASKDANDVLKKFFKPLKDVNAEFGYRTAAEIGRFISLADSMTVNEKIDSAIVQKILPKLHGSRKKIIPVLTALWKICGCNINLDLAKSEDCVAAVYPLSADKIFRMYQGAIDNGFTSFAEA